MKMAKRMFTILMSVLMVLALALPAFAEDTGSITIDNATVGNTYTLYKVFEATSSGDNISYKLLSGKTAVPTGFKVDAAGNVELERETGDLNTLTAEEIAGLAAYIDEQRIPYVETKAANETTVAFTGLEDGYYYITTTTGTAVTVTSGKGNAVTVHDKNEAPELDKTITDITGSEDPGTQNALAQLGSEVTFQVTIKVKNGAKGYVLHDTMSSGLSFNGDVTVTVGDEPVTESQDTYTKDTSGTDTFKLTFNDEWIQAQVDKTVVVTYTATVTSDALIMNPATNTASLDYGDVPNVVAIPEDKTPSIYNATVTVTKTDGEDAPLPGAGFVLKNAAGKYYKNDNNVVSWVNTIGEATERVTTTGGGGNVIKFTGLANGTYTLIENTVPAGYNKAADQTVMITDDDFTENNLSKSFTVVNEAGAQLPSTGGMGTVMFYVLGGVLVVAAGVLLVTKRRMKDDK